MLHRLIAQLAATNAIVPKSGDQVNLFKSRVVSGVPYYGLKIINGVPSGTPNAAVAINVAAGAAGSARVYTDNNGAWAAQTT